MQLWEPDDPEPEGWAASSANAAGFALCLVVVIFVVPNLGEIARALEALLHGGAALPPAGLR